MHSPDEPVKRRTTTISHQTDFTTYLKSQLVKASSKLKNRNPPDIYIAGRLDHIVATAEFIPSGYWIKIQPLYEPYAPRLQQAVHDLNRDLVSGTATAANFNIYIELLVGKISEPVSA